MMAYKPGQYLTGLLEKAATGKEFEMRDRLRAIPAALELLVGGKLTGSIADLMSPKKAYAGERISIEEYYQRATPADEIMPGARIGEYKVPITGLHRAFLNGKWNEYYFSNSVEGEKIKSILKNDSNVNFELFNDYYKEEGNKFKNVVIHTEGYLRFDTYSREFKMIFPISKETVNELQEIKGIR